MEKKKVNQLKDFQHKLSLKMVNNTKANTIIVGDMKVKNMAQSKKQNGKKKRAQNRSTQNQGDLSRFIEFLTYKAELIGKRVIRFDESYTSKACYVVEKFMKCRYGREIWNVIVEIIMIEIETCYQYHVELPITECLMDRLPIFR